jgi:hypothetical protein
MLVTDKDILPSLPRSLDQREMKTPGFGQQHRTSGVDAELDPTESLQRMVLQLHYTEISRAYC